MKTLAGALLLISALASTPRAPDTVDPLPRLPRVMLWAWERPENLPDLDPQRFGIAVLAGTVSISDQQTVCQPRRQPLRIPDRTPLVVTVRVESQGDQLPPPSDVAACALAWSAREAPQALQIDFDAKLSERSWYRRLLTELRQKLPASTALTITALASWCEQDGWIRDLPITEAVPMLFRMGQGEVWNRRDFDVPLCRASVGVATDELPTSLPANRRIYFFHPRRWTEDSYHAAWLAYGRFQ